MSPTRRWHKTASAMLLVAAGVHLALHFSTFVGAAPAGDAARRSAIAAMQAYVVYEPLGTTLWTVMGAFSLAYAAVLILFATSQWILAREADPRTLRRHALRNAVLATIAQIALYVLHPQPQLLVVFGLAAVMYALAAWPRRLDL